MGTLYIKMQLWIIPQILWSIVFPRIYFLSNVQRLCQMGQGEHIDFFYWKIMVFFKKKHECHHNLQGDWSVSNVYWQAQMDSCLILLAFCWSFPLQFFSYLCTFNLFPELHNHQFDTTSEENHALRLVNIVASEYCKIMLHHLGMKNGWILCLFESGSLRDIIWYKQCNHWKECVYHYSCTRGYEIDSFIMMGNASKLWWLPHRKLRFIHNSLQLYIMWELQQMHNR